MACCPAHQDRDPSLAITNAQDGSVLMRCHPGCDQRDVIEALRARGLWEAARHNSGRRRADPPAYADQIGDRQHNGSEVMTKVLYVEDNDDNVYMLKMRLELLGDFEVLTAEDGQRGCEMAIKERPDVILMDLEMPVMDGWEAARRLKSAPATSDIPIIGLSAHALAGERQKALAAGCDEFEQNQSKLSALSQPFGDFVA